MPTHPSSVSQLGLIAEYVETLAKDPRSSVFVPLSEIYRKMGLLDDAYQVASNGVRHLPGYAAGHIALGRVQGQRGDWTAAAVSFAKALELEAENLAALKGLARARAQSGDTAAARQLLEQAAALAPGDEAVRRLLTSLPPASEAPAPDAASIPANRTSRRGHRSPADPFTTVTIAEIYIRQGFLRRALKIFRDLLAAQPGNEEIRQRLIALKRQIEEEEAREAEGEALDEFSSFAGPAGEVTETAAPEPAVENAPPETEEASTLVAEPSSSAAVAEALRQQEAEEAPEPRPTEATAAAVDAPLTVLTRWLSAIQQRRAHVS